MNYVKHGFMCNINGCDAAPIAHGLCARHYMRMRRTGDPEKVRRAGRPRDEAALLWRQALPDESPRTMARILHSRKIFMYWGVSALVQEDMIKDCTRPSGTVNWSKLERLAIAVDEACRREFPNGSTARGMCSKLQGPPPGSLFYWRIVGAPARGKPCRGARASAHRKVACGPRSWNFVYHAVQGHRRAHRSK